MQVFLIFLVIGLGSVGAAALIIALQVNQRVSLLEATIRRLQSKLSGMELQGRTEFPLPSAPPAQPATVAGALPSPQPSPASTRPAVATVPEPVHLPVAAAPPGIPPGVIAAAPPPSAGPSARPAPAMEDSLAAFERLVGTRWLNWVGALVMLVGVAFLLKFLYDRGWINPAGRVAIGMGFGIGLLYLGEFRLRAIHDLLSESVSAAGCGALFLTAFLSFKFYEFSGRTATFALLCWFAAFTVGLAIIRRGRILAFLGLLGAYLTPYLLSTGQDQAEQLFSYLAVLALAAAGVQAARGWCGIASLSLAFTWLYYVGWFYSCYTPQRLPIAVVGAAGMILFIGAGAVARGLWQRAAVRIEEVVVFAAASILGLYHLWDVLIQKHQQALGFALCGIALTALAALKAARSRQASTSTLETALLGLGAGSLLLVIPACLSANGEMLAWALAAVILANIGARSRILVLEIAAGVCLLAGPWVGLQQGASHTGLFMPIANRVFLVWLCVIAAWFLAGSRYFRASPAASERNKAGMGLQVASSFMLIALLSYEAVAWFSGKTMLPDAEIATLHDWRTVTLCLLWALYPASWLRWAKLRPDLRVLTAAHYAVLSIAFISLLPALHQSETLVFLNPIFFAAALFLAGVFLAGWKITALDPRVRSGLQIYAHLLFIILISVELYQGLFLSAYSSTSLDWIRMALISAAWAVYATVLLGIGISRNLKAWRWLALGILGATLLKVFVVDLAEVRQIWRVVSFMVLGVLLMVCSYAYSRHERMKRISGKVLESGKEVNP